MTAHELIHITFADLTRSLPTKIDLGGLLARNAIAHKWKAPYFSLVLRESVYWRFTDLISQSLKLGEEGSIVGSRILARAAIETLATLVYLNIEIGNVLQSKLDFHDFGAKLEAILVGSRINEYLPQTINVLTLVTKTDKKHPGILRVFEELCETAHPSYVSLTVGYTKSDHQKVETVFGNYWKAKFGLQHEEILLLCLRIFEDEYNNVSVENFESLEKWLVENDTELEKARSKKKKEKGTEK